MGVLLALFLCTLPAHTRELRQAAAGGALEDRDMLQVAMPVPEALLGQQLACSKKFAQPDLADWGPFKLISRLDVLYTIHVSTPHQSMLAAPALLTVDIHSDGLQVLGPAGAEGPRQQRRLLVMVVEVSDLHVA